MQSVRKPQPQRQMDRTVVADVHQKRVSKWSKHIKCLQSLDTGEMQVKTTTKYLYPPSRVAKMRRTDTIRQMLTRLWAKEMAKEGVWIGTITLEAYLRVPTKAEAVPPRVTPPWHPRNAWAPAVTAALSIQTQTGENPGAPPRTTDAQYSMLLQGNSMWWS